jgi:Protein of unknown function (DUF3300)
MSFSRRARIFGLSFAAVAVLAVQAPIFAQAQDSGTQSGVVQASQPQALSDEELQTLVARVALYPDDLVALVLAGSLYPLQIVQADRYLADVKKKPGLKPDPDWDGSVISLLNYPEVIDMMNGDLDWTQKLGEAVVNQQKDVLEAIQDLRDRAVANKVIKSNDKVIVEEKNENIVITPAKKEVTYVPQYDPVILSPTYVYEEQAPPPVYYSDPYPSYYYPYAPYWTGFVTGAIWGAAIDWDNWHSWGGDVDVDIDIDNIDRNDFNFDRNNINNINWDKNKFNFDRDSIGNNLRQNNSDRLDRKGARDRSGLSNFGQGNRVSGNDVRRDVQRDLKRQGQAKQRPAGGKLGQGGAGQRPAQTARAGAGQRPAQTARAGAGSKRGGANKPAQRKAASKVDRRPRQTSGLGDYGRGRDAKQFSQRGQSSRMSRGGRGGYGGGGQVRRRPSGGFGGGGGRGRGGGGRGRR